MCIRDSSGNVSLMALRDRPRETQAHAGTSAAAVNPSTDLRVEYIGSAKDFKRTVMEAFQAANHDTKIMMQVYHFDCPMLLEALKKSDPWSIDILADARAAKEAAATGKTLKELQSWGADVRLVSGGEMSALYGNRKEYYLSLIHI